MIRILWTPSTIDFTMKGQAKSLTWGIGLLVVTVYGVWLLVSRMHEQDTALYQERSILALDNELSTLEQRCAAGTLEPGLDNAALGFRSPGDYRMGDADGWAKSMSAEVISASEVRLEVQFGQAAVGNRAVLRGTCDAGATWWQLSGPLKRQASDRIKTWLAKRLD